MARKHKTWTFWFLLTSTQLIPWVAQGEDCYKYLEARPELRGEEAVKWVTKGRKLHDECMAREAKVRHEGGSNTVASGKVTPLPYLPKFLEEPAPAPVSQPRTDNPYLKPQNMSVSTYSAVSTSSSSSTKKEKPTAASFREKNRGVPAGKKVVEVKLGSGKGAAGPYPWSKGVVASGKGGTGKGASVPAAKGKEGAGEYAQYAHTVRSIRDPKELEAIVMDYAADLEGDRSRGKFKIYGKFFNDCKIEVTTPKNPEVCGGNRVIVVSDLTGEAKECMDWHRANGDVCTKAKCSDLSEIGAVIDYSRESGDFSPAMMSQNPNGNARNQYNCVTIAEDTAEKKYSRLSRETIASRASDKKAARRAAQIANLESQARCYRNFEELAIARAASQSLLLMGHLTPEQHGMMERKYADRQRKLDAGRLESIRRRAKAAPLAELPEVRRDLLDWLASNADRCNTTVDIYRTMAKRYVPAKVKRRGRGDYNPLEGYDEALSMIDEGMDESSCLADSSELADMRSNLNANRVDQMGQLYGFSNQEFQAEYTTLVQDMQEEVWDQCALYPYDRECMALRRTASTVGTIPMMAYQSEMRHMQAEQEIQMMLMQSGVNPMGVGMGPMMGSPMGGMGGMRSSGGFGRL